MTNDKKKGQNSESDQLIWSSITIQLKNIFCLPKIVQNFHTLTLGLCEHES